MYPALGSWPSHPARTSDEGGAATVGRERVLLADLLWALLRDMPPKAAHPILIQNMPYRRAVIRHCAEQIREIEGRLVQGCGTRFEQQLQGCDDMNTVARLLLVLQRRADMKDVDNGWLEELSTIKPDDLDDRCIEMVRGLFVSHA